MNEATMNIGEAAAASGVSAKMIRHYEDIGLVAKAKRTSANYRRYSGSDVHTLRFIKQARSLGFSIEQIQHLLGLWNDHRRPSRKVKELALAHVQELEQRIQELQDMKQTLERLAKHCHGDDRPDCPILERLAAADQPAAGAAPKRNGATGRARRGISARRH